MINQLKLNVPTVSDLHPACSLVEIREWLGGLPKLNELQVFGDVTRRLRTINRTPLKASLRHEIMECFSSELAYLTDKLARRCELAEFPMTEAEQALIDRLHALLEELACGYKHVLLGLVNVRPDDPAQVLIRSALYQAMRFLSLRVLHSYSVYSSVPTGVWGEVHRLYRYAEQVDVAYTRVEHLADQSIGNLYRQILLLSLANPSHLMQGEARGTHERLAKWALACRLRHPAEYPPEVPETFYAARCFVDLESDSAPRWGLLAAAQLPADARIIEIQAVARLIQDRIQQMSLKAQLPMQERMERDLLRRLHSAWSGRSARADNRTIKSGEIQVVSGLRAIHYSLSRGVDFHPEQHEIALHGQAFRAEPTLSLLSMEEEPWRNKVTQDKLEQGLLTPRGYAFDSDRREDNVWDKSTRVGAQKSTSLEERMDDRLLNRRGLLQQRDISVSGIGADYGSDAGLKLRVGDLVGLTAENTAENSSGLGIVSWLRETGPAQMSMGLHYIEGAATALAVRGIDGVGADSEYHRALGFSVGDERMLVVPAGIFDVGSHVLYNARVALGVLLLRRIVRSTKTFTQYGVDSMVLSEALREVVLKGLYRLLDSTTT